MLKKSLLVLMAVLMLVKARPGARPELPHHPRAKNLPWAITDYYEWLRCKFPWPWTWFRRRKPDTRRMGGEDNFDLRDQESKINFTIERNGIIHTYDHENTTEIKKPYNQIEPQMRYNINSATDNVDHEVFHSFNSDHNRKDFEAFYDDRGSVDYSENKNQRPYKNRVNNSKQINNRKFWQLNTKRNFSENQGLFQKEFHENYLNYNETSRFRMNIPSNNYSYDKHLDQNYTHENYPSQNSVSDYIDYDLFDSLNTFHDRKDFLNRSISHGDASIGDETVKNDKINRANQIRKYNSKTLGANKQFTRNNYKTNKNNENLKKFKNPENYEEIHANINRKYSNKRNKGKYYQNRKYGEDDQPLTRKNKYKSILAQTKDKSGHFLKDSDNLFKTKEKLYSKKTDKETYLKYHGSDGRHIPSPLNEYNEGGTDDFYRRKYNFEESKELVRLLEDYETQNDFEKNQEIQDHTVVQSAHNSKEAQQNFNDISDTTYVTNEPYLNEDAVIRKSMTKTVQEKIRAEEYFESYDEVTESRPKTYEEYYEDDKAIPGLKYHI